MPARRWFATLVVMVATLGACAAPGVAPVTQAPPVETDAPDPTDEPTEKPTEDPTEEPTEEPTEAAGDELDYTRPPNFGSTDLTSGFQPDPFSVELVSGGPTDVSYLGDDCRGFATVAPDYDVTYEAGTLDLLRFYFVADTEDTTMIVNAPDGSWHCNDDAPGTIDPQVDFDDPASGLYDVWIGSYTAGTENAGTLYVTELELNGP